MSEQVKPELKPLWVTLHLEPQSERSTMPPAITGLLVRETATGYVLDKLARIVENEETYERRLTAVDERHHVNRTYVWDCEVHGETLASVMVDDNYSDEGGLG